MFTRREFIGGVLAFAGSTGWAAPPNAPAAVVNRFFRFHFAHDMGFTAKTVQARKKWLSSGLLAACETYFKQPQPADEAPDIDGDPFTNSQEYPHQFTIRSAEITKGEGRVEVLFRWKEGKRDTVFVVLKNSKTGWLIDDLVYSDGSTFRQLLAPTSAH